ncbi:MAG: TonB-dependent receptor [Bacteroidia bacterium]|nr:TonB-dependent receptor [Bacteroidia bacterium]
MTKTTKFFTVLIFIWLSVTNLSAQQQGQGSVSGFIFEKTSNKPLEFANVIFRSNTYSKRFMGTVTGRKGEFTFDKLEFGEYKVIYSFIGFDKIETPVFTLNSKQSKLNLGKLYIAESTAALGEVSVTAQRSTFVNSIDRKTFNVGQDVMSKTGSVSELLQNVPSVQVDIDGNVSLRGSGNVMFLINGKPSALMGANRAAVLQQMPASSIEKIEIITNPSAKYKPDGTSGIINIVLKKDKNLGLNGLISMNAGNDKRYNGSFSLNYNPGKINVFGSYSIRQDDRLRYNDDYREHFKLNTDTVTYTHIISSDHSRPLSHIFQTGADYKINSHNTIGVTGSYNYRDFIRNANDANLWQGTDLTITKDYDCSRKDPEFEKDLELNANYTHSFAKEDHELTVDYTASFSKEQEDNHYTNTFRIPVMSPTYDNTLIKQGDNESQFSVEYVNPIAEDIKIEAGYLLESIKSDMNFFGESYDQLTSQWIKDTEKSNQFIYKEYIHVLYGTYEMELGKFGFLAGLRAEQAFLNANQVTTDTVVKNSYFRIYPSLHLAYKLSEANELQLNYSHRIRRPEGDEMNPFPEYADPYNLRIGNPHLKPADVHSVEFGYQYKKNKTTFLSTVYYRYTYNGMTDITSFLHDTIKVTTRENLTKSNSAGLELILSTAIGDVANINLSTNTFYNTIDASNLGYSKKKSIIAWSANLSAGINLSKSTVFQITSSYVAETLTPQGKQLSSFVINTGFKQELFKRKLALIVTVSDVFNSLKSKSLVDTPELYEKIVRRRSSRVIYAGFTYTFGNQKKKELEYDNKL